VTDLIVTRATAADAPDLGIIGPAAYAAAYHDDWDDAAGFFQQLKTFGAEAMLTTLARLDARVWIARQDGVGVGFLSMFVGSLEPINHKAGGAEIPRIYLLPGARRGGIGKKLLEAAEAQAKADGVQLCLAGCDGACRMGPRRLRALGFCRYRQQDFFGRSASGP